ncbi:MAG: ADP-ribosylation factor-like protein [Promethearchaeota archaeon]
MENLIEKIKDFFKSNTFVENQINSMEDIIKLDLSYLRGISPIHAEKLAQFGINTIEELAKVETPPNISDMPQNIFLKLQRTAIMLVDFATKPRERKIIMLGLDNAGKTTLLSVIQNKYSAIKNLLPTRGVQRQSLSFMGTNVIAWDFGGQIGYRDYYLSRGDLWLESDLFIYVIDVLDVDRFDEAFGYFCKIIETIKNLNECPPIIVDMHKVDPDVKTDENLTIKRAELIDKIAAKTLELGFECTFINTTIFLRESVEQLFSLAMQKMSSSNLLMQHLVVEFAEKINAEAIALMTDQNFILCSYAKDEVMDTIVTQSGLLLQALISFYTRSGFKPETDYFLSLKQNQMYLFAKKLFTYKNENLYLWCLFKDKKPSEDLPGFNEFVKELKPVVFIY